MYFDQLMAVYAHYHVLSSKIKVTYMSRPKDNENVKAGSFIVMAVNLTSGVDASALGAIAVGERPGAGFAIVNNRDVNPKSVHAKYSKAASLALAALATGDVASNPTELATYTVSIDGGTEVVSQDIILLIELEYTAQFDDLNAIGTS